eukprot:m.9708 g.9708  ORF g.9708 m.9708 type:complete len:337 (-) comp5484_c0_seq1:80-1090(-)
MAEAPEEQVESMSKKELLSKMRQTGMNDYNPEYADGQLQYHLNSDDEKRHFVSLKKKLAEKRAKQEAGELEKLELDTSKPGYLEDGTPAADFWLMACLRSRKYDEDRALVLYDNYRSFRIEYGVEDEEDPDHEMMVALLKRNFFRVGGNQDKHGRYIFSMDVEGFYPSEWSPRSACKAMHHHISWLLMNHPEAQVRGTVTIGNMDNWSMKNFDPELEKGMMKAMQDAIPMRDGGFFAIHTPLLIRAVMPIVKLFMKKKMRDRMKFYKNPADLLKHVDESQLDIEFGGTFVRDLSSTQVNYDEEYFSKLHVSELTEDSEDAAAPQAVQVGAATIVTV